MVQEIDNGYLMILTVRHDLNPTTLKEYAITTYCEDSSMRYKKGMAFKDVDWFDPEKTPALLQAFRGTGEKITFPLDDSHISAFTEVTIPERVMELMKSKNKDACVIDAAVKMYIDADKFITSQMENACMEYSADADHKTGQKNFDTGLDRRVEGPCDIMWIDVCSLAAMADNELSKLVDKVLQLASVA